MAVRPVGTYKHKLIHKDRVPALRQHIVQSKSPNPV